MKADTPRLPRPRAPLRKLWKNLKSASRERRPSTQCTQSFKITQNQQFELSVINETQEPTPVWSNAKYRNFIKVNWGSEFEVPLNHEGESVDQENNPNLAN